MADPLDLHNESAFEGFLRWMGRPRSAVVDALRGNVSGAGRQLADFALDPIDAVLPGDLIPAASRPMDNGTASDLVGGMEPGLSRTAVDVLGNTLLDPITYTGFGPVAKAGAAAGRTAAGLARTVPALDRALTAAEAAGKGALFQVKRATGTFTPTPENAAIAADAAAKGGATRMAAQGAAIQAFKDVDPVTQRRAIETIRGVSSELPGTTGYADLDAAAGLPARSTAFGDMAEQMARVDARLAQMPWAPAEKQAVRDTAERAITYTRGQWSQGLRDKVFQTPEGTDAAHAPLDYLPGVYEMDDAAKAAGMAGQPGIIDAKTIRSSASLADWLNNAKGTLDADLPALLGDYGARMGQAVKSAEVGQRIAPGTFKALSDEGSRTAVREGIAAMEAAGKRDDAEVLRTAFSGLPPRQGLTKILADYNTKLFKPFATGGAILPRPAFTTRNVLSSVWMVASNPEARHAALGQLARVPGDLLGAWSDGLRKLGVPLPTPAHEAQVEAAIKASGGDRERMIAAITDPVLRDAVRTGVLDSGFVTSEGMMAGAEQAAKGAGHWRNWRDWPQAITKGSEDRMRLGLFTQLVDKGMPAEQAARVVKDSLYDYAYSSVLNRNIRDAIPFFQFTAKAVPQQAKLLLEKGALPSVARNTVESLYDQGSDAVLPPQLQDAASVPLGRDERGDPTYLTSFGMPFESLAQVPNLTGNIGDVGPELRQNVVAASNPVLKAAYSLVSGEDPYFGTPFGSYDKTPYAAQALGMEPHGEAARIYNLLASSGAIQPISAPVGVVSAALDPRRTGTEAALNTLTGLRIKSVDEEQATRQLLEETLRRNPRVQRYESLYQQSPDTDTQQLLDALKNVKREQAAKRKAAKAAATV